MLLLNWLRGMRKPSHRNEMCESCGELGNSKIEGKRKFGAHLVNAVIMLCSELLLIKLRAETVKPPPIRVREISATAGGILPANVGVSAAVNPAKPAAKSTFSRTQTSNLGGSGELTLDERDRKTGEGQTCLAASDAFWSGESCIAVAGRRTSCSGTLSFSSGLPIRIGPWYFVKRHFVGKWRWRWVWERGRYDILCRGVILTLFDLALKPERSLNLCPLMSSKPYLMGNARSRDFQPVIKV
jgi:hypothetical protein